MRPAVVVTRDPLSRILPLVHVIPATTRIRNLPTELEIGDAEGVRQTSVLNTQNIQPVPQAALLQRIGFLADDRRRELCSKLALAFGCD